MRGLSRAVGRAGTAGIAQFLRFCTVGAVGFVVDAGVLLALIHALGVGPIAGRLLSFMVAVLTTFELNRRWAFRAKKRASYLAALTAYLGVQGFGFCCNFGIYTLLYLTLPPNYASPLFCLTVASAIALVVNYTGASLVVFRPEKDAAPAAGAGQAEASGAAADAEAARPGT